MECAICLDPLATGVICTLPCAHNFCLECLGKARKQKVRGVDWITCPLCQKKHKLETGVEGLPRTSLIASMAEKVWDARKVCSTTPLM